MATYEVVFETPWFRVEARPAGPSAEDASRPYYVVCPRDYVAVLATTPAGEVLLVDVYRPALPGVSLELPSGTVDRGESPADAAARELLEETGCVAARLELMEVLSPDSGRLGNQMHCFRAWDARPAVAGGPRGPEVIRLHCIPARDLVDTVISNMTIALHLGVIGVAIMRGMLDILPVRGGVE